MVLLPKIVVLMGKCAIFHVDFFYQTMILPLFTYLGLIEVKVDNGIPY